MREIEESDAIALLNGFQEDYNRYKFIAVNAAIVNRASNLIVKYGAQGLRTLDAIQLSCAIEERNQITVVKTSDEKLEDFLKQEGIG